MSEAGASDYAVAGQVSFHNLMQIRAEGEAAIASAGDRVVIDLAGLENGNGAAVALLMAWFRAAQIQDKAIVFTAAPTELENIVELSGLSEVLPVQGAGAGQAPDAFPAEAHR